jgi:hypothetical protein
MKKEKNMLVALTVLAIMGAVLALRAKALVLSRVFSCTNAGGEFTCSFDVNLPLGVKPGNQPYDFTATFSNDNFIQGQSCNDGRCTYIISTQLEN